MILGSAGDVEKAIVVFNQYYQKKLYEYNMKFEHGIKTYLFKGERLVYRNTKIDETETIVAKKDGYVIAYSANGIQLDYLEQLAE